MREGQRLCHEGGRLRAERNAVLAAARSLHQQLAEAREAAWRQRTQGQAEVASLSNQLATARAHGAQLQAQLHATQHALQEQPVRTPERMDVVRFPAFYAHLPFKVALMVSCSTLWICITCSFAGELAFPAPIV